MSVTDFPPPPRKPAGPDRRTGEPDLLDFNRWVKDISEYLARLIARLTEAASDVTDAAARLDAVEADLSTAQSEIAALEASDATHVVGPASATDHAIARFDGATGKLVDNSTATLSDAGVLNVDGSYQVDGVKVLGNQGAAVADAAGGAVIDVEARAAINALLARFRTHGSIAT